MNLISHNPYNNLRFKILWRHKNKQNKRTKKEETEKTSKETTKKSKKTSTTTSTGTAAETIAESKPVETRLKLSL